MATINGKNFSQFGANLLSDVVIGGTPITADVFHGINRTHFAHLKSYFGLRPISFNVLVEASPGAALLPAAYQEVESLTAPAGYNGGIPTVVVNDSSGFAFEGAFELATIPNNGQVRFFSTNRPSDNAEQTVISVYGTSGTNRVYEIAYKYESMTHTTAGTSQVSVKSLIEYWSQELYINDNLVLSCGFSNDYIVDATLCVLPGSMPSAATITGRAKIWNSTAQTTVIADLVPCYRKSDNVPGLYNLINNTFYPEAHTGSVEMEVGADVEVPTAIETAISNKSAFDAEMFNGCELGLFDDGRFYTCKIVSLGEAQIECNTASKVLLRASYALEGICHGEKVTVSGASPLTVSAVGTMPFMDCKLSTTAPAAAATFQLGNAVFHNVAANEALVFDGILGQVLRNGIANAANVTFSHLPYLTPGSNVITAGAAVTVEYYPTYI